MVNILSGQCSLWIKHAYQYYYLSKYWENSSLIILIFIPILSQNWSEKICTNIEVDIGTESLAYQSYHQSWYVYAFNNCHAYVFYKT